MLVKPHSIATTTAVDVKLGIREDLVTSHDMSTIGAKLQFRYFPGWVNFNGSLLWRKFTP